MYLLENFAPSYEAKFATKNSFFSNSATERATKPYIETNPNHETLALTINLVDPAYT